MEQKFRIRKGKRVEGDSGRVRGKRLKYCPPCASISKSWRQIVVMGVGRRTQLSLRRVPGQTACPVPGSGRKGRGSSPRKRPCALVSLDLALQRARCPRPSSPPLVYCRFGGSQLLVGHNEHNAKRSLPLDHEGRLKVIILRRRL